MQELTSVRKSGRKRYPSRKYSIDPFEGLEGLSSGSEGNENVKQHAESSDEEVGLAREEASVVPDAYDANQDEAFGSSGDASLAEEDDPDDANDADEASDAGNAIDADANGLSSSLVNVRDSDPVNHATGKDKNLRYKLRPKQYLKGIIRSRGLIELSSKSPSKEDMLKFMAGGHPQDWVDFLRAKERWLSDPTLPTREGDKEGKEAMCYHFSHTDDNRKMEATIGWDWYYDQGGRELFAKRQKVQVLTPDEGRAYMTKPAEPSRKFLMGPYGRQQVFSLETGRSMCLNEAWKPAHETSHPVTEPGSLREGWMLNLGTSVRCLDWATNQDGNVQYLAAATAQPKASPSHGLSEVSPAFTPSLPMRSCIQIWAFAATQAPKHESLLDSRNPPTLQLVICTEWGEIKQLKWCQIPREFRTDDLQNQTPIGLLAGVWTDGLVRVLDIHLEQKGDATSYGKCIIHSFYMHSLTSIPFSKVR
jgi:transcription factor C subunit 6